MLVSHMYGRFMMYFLLEVNDKKLYQFDNFKCPFIDAVAYAEGLFRVYETLISGGSRGTGVCTPCVDHFISVHIKKVGILWVVIYKKK